jgi:hypothetical protein
LITITSVSVYSQTLETGLTAGGMYYLGDINSKTHFQSVNGAAGFAARLNLDNRWAVKFNGIFGVISGDDLQSGEVIGRELGFRTTVYEFSAVTEFNFWEYETGTANHFAPFIYAGIGASLYNPQFEVADRWVDLRDYGTEGQNVQYLDRSPYGTSTIVIPFGVGIKYSLSNVIGVSVEWGMRKTFTDYLDDVSTTYYLDGPSAPSSLNLQLSDPTKDHDAGMQRGNPDTKDWYSFFGITLTYKFNLSNENCAEF